MLTPRETQVAALLAKGRTYKAIARELHISTATVRNHVISAANKIPGPPDVRAGLRIAFWYNGIDDEDSDAA